MAFLYRFQFHQVRAQGRLTQDVPQWHTDYSELKLFKNLSMQAENPYTPSPLEAEITLHVTGALPSPEGWETTSSQS